MSGTKQVRPIGTCACCGTRGELVGRNLIRPCYQQHRKRGTLGRFPRVGRPEKAPPEAGESSALRCNREHQGGRAPHAYNPHAQRVLACLKASKTVAETERLTGFPAAAIRLLIGRQPGWLLGVDGRVCMPGKFDTPEPEFIERTGVTEPRSAEALLVELKVHKKALGWTWQHVAGGLGMSPRTLDSFRYGQSSRRTRVRVEEWLAKTALAPHRERQSA